jgi:hypothetical protein
MKLETLFNESHRATYCPEDNNLRLYIGRVPREEYLWLKGCGFRALYKQREAGQGDFVATWTPSRRDIALAYAGLIEDEDAGPEERAADRAERFGGYCEKRRAEAEGQADKYEAGPSAFGNQDRGRAVRAADRADRVAGRAVDAWDKAEYWQRRTAGVIAHRLYLSSPAVRMGRIKTLESELRKYEGSLANQRKVWAAYCKLREMEAGEAQTAAVLRFVGSLSGMSVYLHPRAAGLVNPYMRGNPVSLYSLMTCEADPITGAEALALWFSDHSEPGAGPWFRHYEMRLAYEHQMLEAQGGRAAFVEMEVGGFLGNHQIRKVNKSPATGRVVSVTLRMQGNRWGNEAKPGEYYDKAFNIERLPSDAYRAPTEEEKAAFSDKRKAEKKAAKEKAIPCPLINPTDEDAERLQEMWNDKGARSPEHRQKVLRITQAEYSARSGGTYARCSTVVLCETGHEHRTRYGSCITRHDCCKVRQTYGTGSYTHLPRRVIVLTDVPQKAIPWAAMEKARASCPSEESMWDRLPEVAECVRGGTSAREGKDQLLADAEYVGWIRRESWSQVPFTEKGIAALKAWEAEDKAAPVVAASAPVAERAAVGTVARAARAFGESPSGPPETCGPCSATVFAAVVSIMPVPAAVVDSLPRVQAEFSL